MMLQKGGRMYEINIPDIHLQRIADSGQCFRMTADGNTCRVLAKDKHVLIQKVSENTYLFDCSKEEFDTFWHPYFDLGFDYQKLNSMVPKDDAFLQEAIAYSAGMCILRQDPWETLISFILSQRKSIPAIRGCVDSLCRLFGKPIPGTEFFAFPAPEALAFAGEEKLKSCGLGYRTRYVQGTARMVAEGGIDLDALHALQNDALQEQLCRFPGVGIKVAQCVMLFAYARRGAFPRDVWIQRIEQQEYNGRFPEENYPGTAGILQQYMFFFGKSKDYLTWKEQNGQAAI